MDRIEYNHKTKATQFHWEEEHTISLEFSSEDFVICHICPEDEAFIVIEI